MGSFTISQLHSLLNSGYYQCEGSVHVLQVGFLQLLCLPAKNMWIGYNKMLLGVNECVNVCSWCPAID